MAHVTLRPNPPDHQKFEMIRSCGISFSAERKGEKKCHQTFPITAHSQLHWSGFHLQAHLKRSHSLKYCRGTKSMKMPVRKIIPSLVFILASMSILRLAKIAFTTSSTPPLPALSSTKQKACSSSSPSACNETQLQPPSSLPIQHSSSVKATAPTKKEFKLLSRLIKSKAPCNLLIFGAEPQYVKLASLNAGGNTVILEDDPDKISSIKKKFNSTKIYKLKYQTPAKKAYMLLEYAKTSPACAPNTLPIQNSTCKLALKDLPHEVYDLHWDVVVVDAPSGHSLEAPGRMAAIYTAGLIARAGNSTDVVVHDVDRTIEKWFSWEFLCDENLVSSKGRLWNFRITGNLNSTKFCSDGIPPIM